MTRRRVSLSNFQELTPAMKARIAFMRFGLGPKPGGANRIGMHPSSALQACLRELDTPQVAHISDPRVRSFTAAHCCWNGEMQGVREFHVQCTAENSRIIQTELSARYAKHMEPEVGFVERLVLFWANHFNIDRWSSFHVVRASIGQFEREVIRKHVLGNFADMLQAVYQHPAMLCYLDNSQSTAKLRNENLARECLELHTLGVNGPYMQDDIVALSHVLTGWNRYTVGASKNNEKAGQFRYRHSEHSKGAFTVLEKQYPETPGSNQQGLNVLRDLALHSATATHIAYKLLVHFVTDSPDKTTVDKLANAFLRSKGNLKVLAKALLETKEAWTSPNRLRHPHLWIISQMRALNFDGSRANKVSAEIHVGDRIPLNYLRNKPWECRTPDGFPDSGDRWLYPDAMRLRVHVALTFINQACNSTDYRPAGGVHGLAGRLFPGSLSRETENFLRNLPQTSETEKKNALATFFMTPEFLYR